MNPALLIMPISLKRYQNAYVGETGRKWADCFREHPMYIHSGSAKSVSLNFNNPDYSGEDGIAVTLKSCSSDQINHQIVENRFIHSLVVFIPTGINIQYTFP